MQVPTSSLRLSDTSTEHLKSEITKLIAGHFEVYRPTVEGLTDEILSLLEQHISCSLPE